MTFDEILEQARELLQSKGRVAYRALKRRFDLDDEYLEDLKAELIDAEHVACDEDGKVLMWVGQGTEEESGNRGNREILALGETPNIAARIQGQAGPNTVVISATTYRLVEGLFECEDRGQPALKGVSIPLTLYHVLKEGKARSRFQVVARKGLTPLVGREHEFGL